MKIIVDAFGGDNAPLEIIKGSQMAVDEFGVDILLVGNESKIRQCVKENHISLRKTEIFHSSGEDILMTDDAKSVLKQKADSSMGTGFTLLNNGEGDAFVSAGNTGAITVGSTLITKRIKGVKRPCIASVMPSAKSRSCFWTAAQTRNAGPNFFISSECSAVFI